MPKKKYRVGMIGVGWGALVQTPGFRAVDGFEVAALCSRRQESVEKAGERLGISDLSTDWKSFVKRDDLDIISVSSPVGHHVSMSIAALEAGKHVVCEKPAALDASSAKDLMQAGEQSGLATAMSFETRWIPHRLAIWEQVNKGLIGNPYFVRICQQASYWHPSHAPQSPWMYKRDEGGGYLMGLQSHDIDFVQKLFGKPIAVCADVKTTIAKREMADGSVIDVDADDTATLLLRLDSGATAVLSASVVGAHTAGQTIDIFGEDGTLVYDGAHIKSGAASDGGLEDLALSAREPASGVDLGTKRSAAMVRAMALMLEEWAPALEGKPTPSVPSFRDGYVTQSVVDAARVSSEGKGWIELSL